jgi:hypothetical protein
MTKKASWYPIDPNLLYIVAPVQAAAPPPHIAAYPSSHLHGYGNNSDSTHESESPDKPEPLLYLA